MTDEEVYQNDVFDRLEDELARQDILQEEYEDYYEPDAHCCSMHQDESGYCEICGAAVPGTYAYFQEYGGE